jgi:hypothetical protein
MAEHHAENARSQLACGLSLFVPAITAHGLVVFNNIGYVAHYFGGVMLALYLTATTAAMAWPHVVSFMGASVHTRITGWALSIFIGWLTVEEHLHASKEWHAPEGASRVLAAMGFADVQAKAVALVAMVALIFVVIEALTHFTHIGWHLTHDAHRKIKGKK